MNRSGQSKGSNKRVSASGSGTGQQGATISTPISFTLTTVPHHVFVTPSGVSNASFRGQTATTFSVPSTSQTLPQLSTIQFPPGLKLEQHGIKLDSRPTPAVAGSSTQVYNAHQSSSILDGLKLEPEVSTYVTMRNDPKDPNIVKYVCSACQFSPKQLGSLIEHINWVHLKRKQFQCSLCPFKSSRKKNFNAHMSEVHLKDKRYPCSLCDFKGARKSSLEKHMQVKHRIDHVCKSCGFRTKNETELRSHMMVTHGFRDEYFQPMINVANQQSSQIPNQHISAQMRQPQVVLSQPHQIQQLQPQSQQQIHQQQAQIQPTQLQPQGVSAQPVVTPTHSKAVTCDQFIMKHPNGGHCCTVCKYSPKTMRYLRDHIRKVHLSKLIKCPHCDLKTKRRADLMKHIKRIHPDAPKNVFPDQISSFPPEELLPTSQESGVNNAKVSTSNVINSIPSNHIQTNDALLQAAIKSEIPITLHLQYPVQSVSQIPVSLVGSQQQTQTQTQSLQITLPTIDPSALMNSYPAPAPPSQQSTATQTHPSNGNNGPMVNNSTPQPILNQSQSNYKKGSQQEFDPNTKCDDLITYSENYPYTQKSCSVCNYSPTSLRYLRDHIRKVHLAKAYKCDFCDLKTKRRADLKRHIKRIHVDPKKKQDNRPDNKAGMSQQQYSLS